MVLLIVTNPLASGSPTYVVTWWPLPVNTRDEVTSTRDAGMGMALESTSLRAPRYPVPQFAPVGGGVSSAPVYLLVGGPG